MKKKYLLVVSLLVFSIGVGVSLANEKEKEYYSLECAFERLLSKTGLVGNNCGGGKNVCCVNIKLNHP